MIDAAKVIVFFGLVASGKSYLASRWARRHGYPYFNTDVIRKNLAGVAPASRQASGYREGLYDRVHTTRTYSKLISLAQRAVDMDRSAVVVLDGSFLDPCKRELVVKTFSTGYDIFFVYCWCSESCTRTRLASRERDPSAVSDGRLDIYLRQRGMFSPPRKISGARLLHLDTEQEVGVLLADVDDFVAP